MVKVKVKVTHNLLQRKYISLCPALTPYTNIYKSATRLRGERLYINIKVHFSGYLKRLRHNLETV